jgi:hypothetical protein
MSTPPEPESPAQRPRIVENCLLVLAALIAHAPLYYQLPRWANGLDPTFVHPTWIDGSSFPVVLYMARIHPIIWILLIILAFVRICWNFKWKLEK